MNLKKLVGLKSRISSGRRGGGEGEAALLLLLLLTPSLLFSFNPFLSPPPADPTNLNSVKKPIFPVSV